MTVANWCWCFTAKWYSMSGCERLHCLACAVEDDYSCHPNRQQPLCYTVLGLKAELLWSEPKGAVQYTVILGCGAKQAANARVSYITRHCEAGTACGWNASWEMDHWCWGRRRRSDTLMVHMEAGAAVTERFILPVVHWQQRFNFSRENDTNQTDFFDGFLRDHTQSLKFLMLPLWD